MKINDASKSNKDRKSAEKLRTVEGQLKRLLESIEGRGDGGVGASKAEVKGSLDAIESITKQLSEAMQKPGKTR